MKACERSKKVKLRSLVAERGGRGWGKERKGRREGGRKGVRVGESKRVRRMGEKTLIIRVRERNSRVGVMFVKESFGAEKK